MLPISNQMLLQVTSEPENNQFSAENRQTHGSVTASSDGKLYSTPVRFPLQVKQMRTPVNIPAIMLSELRAQYSELGEALNELSELQEDDDWRIDLEVYNRACYVASELRDKQYPAPKMFTHGAKSVVFNWHDGFTNFYLTISAKALSALISTPKRIERRMQFNPGLMGDASNLLPMIQYSRYGQTELPITPSTWDASEFS